MRAQYQPKYPYRLEREIAALAAKQRGHVARWQLLDLGLGVGAIKYRVQIGRLHRVLPGVYAVGHRRRAPIDRAAAAVLACGPAAVLSHFSAAALWGWVKDWRDPFEVTVPTDRRPKGIHAYRSDRAELRADPPPRHPGDHACPHAQRLRAAVSTTRACRASSTKRSSPTTSRRPRSPRP